MINENFVYLGIVISFIGGFSYLYATIKGKTKPNRVSWFIWALAPLIAFFAQVSKGVGIQSLITFVFGFNPLLIVIASFFNKKSEWKLTKFDFVCGGLSIIGIILWLIIQNGDIAIACAVLADFLASIPTLKKSFFYPETESYYAYLAAVISSGITLLTIKIWTFSYYAFPLYIFLCCCVFTAFIKFKVGVHLSQKK